MGNKVSLEKEPQTCLGFFTDIGFKLKQVNPIMLQGNIDYIHKLYSGLLVATIHRKKKEFLDLYFLSENEFASLRERSDIILLVPFNQDMIHTIAKGYTSDIDIYTLESLKENLITSIKLGLRSAPPSFLSSA